MGRKEIAARDAARVAVMAMIDRLQKIEQHITNQRRPVISLSLGNEYMGRLKQVGDGLAAYDWETQSESGVLQDEPTVPADSAAQLARQIVKVLGNDCILSVCQRLYEIGYTQD